MIYKDLKALKKDLEQRGHLMFVVDDGLLCERCERWAKHRNDGGHAWGDAVGADCKVNNSETPQQQPPAKVKPEKKARKTK